MYNSLALLSGIIIAIALTFNGKLSDLYGNYNATLIVHITGAFFAFLFAKIRKIKIFPRKKLAFWFYLGGAVGIFNVLFQNFAFGKISLTSILALSLFGQTVMSLFVDHLGLLGMEKHPIKKSSFLGFIFSLAGIVVMLDIYGGIDLLAVLAIILAFSSGFTTVLSRSLNARLSEHIGGMTGSFINHLAGLPLALIFALVMPANDISLLTQKLSPDFWIYLGGLTGVFLIFVLNVTVMKVPSLRLSLLSFVGQVFIGVLLDLALDSGFSRSTFFGGLLVAVGVGLNMLTEYLQDSRVKKEQAGSKKQSF